LDELELLKAVAAGMPYDDLWQRFGDVAIQRARNGGLIDVSHHELFETVESARTPSEVLTAVTLTELGRNKLSEPPTAAERL
jgi:hypothetical protein